jgi:hypothetical protein
MGEEFNVYYLIQIYIPQNWLEIQSVVSKSNLYNRKLAINSICKIKFKFIYYKMGEKFNVYYLIQIYIRQNWLEIQSVVSNSNFYKTNLARNSMYSIKFKFIYDKTGKKRKKVICFTTHTEEADSRSAGCGVLSFYWNCSVIKIFNTDFRF